MGHKGLQRPIVASLPSMVSLSSSMGRSTMIELRSLNLESAQRAVAAAVEAGPGEKSQDRPGGRG